MAGLGFWYWQSQKEAAAPRLLRAEHPREITIGQPFTAQNHSSGYDTATTRFRWELRDARTGELEQQSEQPQRWSFTLDTLRGSADKTLRLLAFEGERRDTFSAELRVRCANRPDAAFTAPKDLVPAEPFTLRPDAPEQPGYTYRWELGDGRRSRGYEVQHAYENAGGYTIRLSIRDTAAMGYCERTSTQDLSVGAPQAFLAFKPLQRDESVPLALHFRTGTWVVLALLLLLAAWFWYRWLRQPPPEPEEPKRQAAALQARFAQADRPPYEIPFRAQDELLRPGPELYRLAQILRLRQEGLRKELDIPATLQQTIEGGGFPAVQFRRTTIPPNYLFLIDEQAPHSHQAQLYRYLLDFLKGQDVHIAAFWYNKTPDRFWNAQHPKGLPLEQLQRLYPHYRLLVLGDAHALLDPTAREQHRVQPELAAAYRRWKSRLLLTPLPANDWTYREATLYDLLAVFPSDMAGVQAAMAYLEEEHEEEDERAMPAFPDWQAAHNQPPQPPATNYRRWNRQDTYEAYFAGKPDLYRWFKALLVYPQPSWPLTLAIGKAIGAPVTFDHMLLLSRLPYLQGQPLPPRLRLKLLAELDAEAEQKARAAVARELQAAAPAVEGGHANGKLQLQLAMQQFLLDPEDDERRAALLHLLDSRALNKRQRAELQEALQRQSGGAVDLRGYLEGEGERGKPRPSARRRLNADFYRALGSTALLLLLSLLLGLFNGRADFGDGDTAENFFYESRPQPDSALLYHNRAVTAWDSLRQQDRQLLAQDLQGIATSLQRAQSLRGGDYPLAAVNARKTAYHQGLLPYHRYLQERDEARLDEAAPYFRQAQPLPDARHALGLLAFYQEQRPAAEDRFYALQADGFFDTLSLTPNLRTLLFPNEGDAVLSDCVPRPAAELLSGDILCLGDTLRLRIDSPAAPIDYYLVRWGDGQADTLQQAGTATHVYRLGGGGLSVQLLAFAECEEEGRAYQIRSFPLLLQAPPRIAALRPAELSVCPPYTFTPQAEVQGSGDYAWDFGNGQRSTEQNPTVTYTEPGTYDLRLRVANACGEDEVVLEGAISVQSPEACADKITLQGQVVDAATDEPLANTALGVTVYDNTGPAREQLYQSEEARFSTSVPVGLQGREIAIALRAEGYRDTTLQRRVGTELLRLPMEKKDTDGDGIPDIDDRCPEEAGVEAEQGCLPSDEATQGEVGPEMVSVQGGTFEMGCESAERDGDCDDNEKPAHEVTVDAFYMSVHEVTNSQFAAFLNAEGNQEEGGTEWYEIGSSSAKIKELGDGEFAVEEGFERHPVVEVSWYGARAYAAWLSEQTGQNYRLPTEAEWEYAARGGEAGAKDEFLYSGSDDIEAVAWYSGNSGSRTHEVGQKQPNQLGLYDMSGNVWEWVQDCWHENYKGAPEDGSAWLESNGGNCGRRVVRGGSWDFGTSNCRVAYRIRINAVNRNFHVGFRLARD